MIWICSTLALATPADAPPADAPPDATCHATVDWILREGDAHAMIATGKTWVRSQTGSEPQVRADLSAACEAARAEPDPEGWRKTDLSPCVVTCAPPLHASLSLVSASPTLHSALSEALGRARAALPRCLERSLEQGESPASASLVARIETGRLQHLQPIAGAPELSRCLEHALRLRLPEDLRGSARLRLSVETHEPTLGEPFPSPEQMRGHP